MATALPCNSQRGIFSATGVNSDQRHFTPILIGEAQDYQITDPKMHMKTYYFLYNTTNYK